MIFSRRVIVHPCTSHEVINIYADSITGKNIYTNWTNLFPECWRSAFYHDSREMFLMEEHVRRRREGGPRREEFAFTRFRWKVLKWREMRGERASVVESCRCISMQPGIFITDREMGRDRWRILVPRGSGLDFRRLGIYPHSSSPELRVNNNRWKIRSIETNNRAARNYIVIYF